MLEVDHRGTEDAETQLSGLPLGFSLNFNVTQMKNGIARIANANAEKLMPSDSILRGSSP